VRVILTEVKCRSVGAVLADAEFEYEVADVADRSIE